MSYNLESAEGLYEFSQACEDACCNCPQYRPWNPIDFDEDRNEVTPLDVFTWWREGVGGSILFDHNYYTTLCVEAKETFKQYVIIRGLDVSDENSDNYILNTYTGKGLSNKPIRILTFA